MSDKQEKTLLDEFAIAALNFLASERVVEHENTYQANFAAKRAYEIAQEMMREKRRLNIAERNRYSIERAVKQSNYYNECGVDQ